MPFTVVLLLSCANAFVLVLVLVLALAIVTVKLFDAVTLFLSVNLRVNEKVPALVGFPVIFAFVPENVSFNPVGRVPERVQV